MQIGADEDLERSTAKLLLKVQEVALALGMSERAVWRLVATGEILPPVRIGRSARWRLVTIDAWLAKVEERAARRQ